MGFRRESFIGVVLFFCNLSFVQVEVVRKLLISVQLFLKFCEEN